MRYDGSGAASLSEASGDCAAGEHRAEMLTFGRNAGLLSIAAAVTAAGNLAFLVILGRSGTRAYGATVGLLVFGAIAAHVQSGIQFAVARETALDNPLRRTVGEGARAAAPWLAAAALIAMASPMIASFLRLPSVVPVLFAVMYAAALILFGVPAGILLGRGKFHAFVLLALVFFGLRMLLSTWFGWSSGSGLGALEATFVAMALTVLLAFGLVFRSRGVIAPVDPAHQPTSIRRDSSYGAFVSAGLWVCWCLPVLFARHFLSTRSAAGFGTAQLIMGGMLFLAAPLVCALYPTVVQHRRAADIRLGLVATLGLGQIGRAHV